MRTLLAFVVIICSGVVQGQDFAGSLTSKLTNATLELRTPAPEVQLTFDATGTPKHKFKHGIRSIDEFLFVKAVKFQEDSVSLEAERLAVVWNPKSQKIEMSRTGMPAYISIDLLKGKSTTEADFVPAFYSVFLKPEEASKRSCDPDEQQRFLDFVSAAAQKRHKKPSDETNKDQPMLCYPGGNRVRLIQSGVTPPKPMHTPDPHYTDVARATQSRGTNVFLVAINEQGAVSDALMVRSLEPTLNYQSLQALREWTFGPAKMDGTPVPCSVMVEINFALW